MVASTDIKFFVHSNNNAPQLQNAYGSMIGVLDACLVNGFGSQAVATLTASGTTVTATYGSAHNYLQYQVTKIAGVNQTEFNGEHRILTVPDANTITFELAVVPSVTTATGTITSSLPSLGWEKPFSSTNVNGGGKAAYRSKNTLLPSRPFLRVVDELDPAYTATYAKYAKVGIVEDMTDIDTMLGVQAPFNPANPNKNWVATGSGATVINGWAKWYYARSPYVYSGSDSEGGIQNGSRMWLIVGSRDYFYITPCITPYSESFPITDTGLPYGFGAFDRYFDDDVSNVFLSASIGDVKADTIYGLHETVGVSSSTKPYILLLRPISQSSTYATGRTAFSASLATFDTGYSSYSSNSSNKMVFYPALLEENNSKFANNVNVLRGALTGIYGLASRLPFADKQVFKQGGNLFISRYCLISTTAERGQIVFKVGEL